VDKIKEMWMIFFFEASFVKKISARSKQKCFDRAVLFKPVIKNSCHDW
jgi:hypothetical protein